MHVQDVAGLPERECEYADLPERRGVRSKWHSLVDPPKPVPNKIVAATFVFQLGFKNWDCKCMYNGMGRTMANSIAHALADGEKAGLVGDWRDGGILGQSGVG
jgi:hypothetical protein